MTSMSTIKLPADQIETDVALVRRLTPRIGTPTPELSARPHARWHTSPPTAPPERLSDNLVWRLQIMGCGGVS